MNDRILSFIFLVQELQPSFMHLHCFEPFTNFPFSLSLLNSREPALSFLLYWPVTLLFIMGVGYTHEYRAGARYGVIKL